MKVFAEIAFVFFLFSSPALFSAQADSLPHQGLPPAEPLSISGLRDIWKYHDEREQLLRRLKRDASTQTEPQSWSSRIQAAQKRIKQKLSREMKAKRKSPSQTEEDKWLSFLERLNERAKKSFEEVKHTFPKGETLVRTFILRFLKTGTEIRHPSGFIQTILTRMKTLQQAADFLSVQYKFKRHNLHLKALLDLAGEDQEGQNNLLAILETKKLEDPSSYICRTCKARRLHRKHKS